MNDWVYIHKIVFFKKTDKSLLPLADKIKACFEELLILEREGCDSIDMVANTSGELIGHVASFGLDEKNSRIAYEIGFHLGKWVYVIDACDDLEEDVKSGSYNVLKHAFGNVLSPEDKALLKNAMLLELDSMSKSVELIDFSSHRDVEGIVKNVVFDGLVSETERVLNKKTKQEKKEIKREKKQEKKNCKSESATGNDDEAL